MSVYKRGGAYHYEFWFRGRRYRQATGLTNKTAALHAEAIHRAELAEGRAGILQRKACPTLDDFVKEEFLPWSAKEHGAHPRTHSRYKVSAKPLVQALGKRALDQISPADVERFKLSRANVISNAGTNRDLAALRFMLNFAIRQGYVVHNPVSDVRLLPEGPGAMRVVSHEEQQHYLAVANPLLRDVALLIAETGMRPEEVYTMRKENVHLEKGYLFVPFGKTRFARRNVPLPQAAIEILKRRLSKADGTYLFPKRGSDEPLTTVRKHHLAALEKAKIRPAFRLYDFRHTFGSRSAMAGIDLATLKELMGHSNISITMRYVHPTPEHKREAVEKLERYNAGQLIAFYERQTGYPQKSPQ